MTGTCPDNHSDDTSVRRPVGCYVRDDNPRVVPVQVARDLQYMYIYGSTNRVSSVGMYLPDYHSDHASETLIPE